MKDILQTKGVIETLLYLLKHPSGRQKIEIRTDLSLSVGTAMKAHILLFEGQYITNQPSFDKLLFGLSRKGKIVALFLKYVNMIVSAEDLQERAPDMYEKLENLLYKISEFEPILQENLQTGYEKENS